jgi:hypothetical protein
MKTLTAQEFIDGIATRIKDQSDRQMRDLTNISTVLRRRYRNRTDADRLGVFSPKTGGWVSNINSQDIYSLNLVTSTIRTNVSAMINANVKIDIQPRFIKDTSAKQAADVAAAVLEKIEREQWTTDLEEIVALEQQLGPGVFVRVRHDKTKKKTYSLPEWEDISVEQPGEAVCTACGAVTSAMGELDEMLACGDCGGLAVVSKMPQDIAVPVPTGYTQHTVGTSVTEIIPFFEIRVDDEDTQGGRLENAKWLDHHYLQSVNELELQYPECNIKDKNEGWSYPLKWQQALKRGWNLPTDDSQTVVEQREVRDIYLTPTMYLNVKMSQEFKLANKEGKVRFVVPKGKTFAEGMFEGEPFEDAPVLRFRIVGNEILDVEPCDFRKEFSYITFLADSSAFWGLFSNDLIVLQDIVNTVLSLQMYHIRRNAIVRLIYNRNSFNPEDMSQDLIPTKEDVPYDQPISNTYSVVPALNMSGEPMQMLGTILETTQMVTLATPAMQGQAQPNEPYAAQALQKQSSLGLLSPAETSKAKAKVRWAKTHLDYAKQYWTDEDTAEMLRLDSEWTEETIDAFLKCNFETDLIIDFVSGSEIPESLIEREIKLNKVLGDLTALMSIDPSLVSPQTLQEVLTQLIPSSVDIDLNNTESDLRLAESRYNKMLSAVMSAPEITADPIVNQEMAMQILQTPDMQPQIWEGHDTQIEFYADKQRNESAKDDPNYLLITCLNGLIQMHLQAKTQFAQMQLQMQMAAQAPAMQMAQEEQVATQEAEAGAEEAKMLEADNAKAQEREDAQLARDHEREMKQLDLEDKERDRQLQREQKESVATMMG